MDRWVDAKEKRELKKLDINIDYIHTQFVLSGFASRH